MSWQTLIHFVYSLDQHKGQQMTGSSMHTKEYVYKKNVFAEGHMIVKKMAG